MRISCNGCRVLRKGCSDSCTIRPCLQWIKTPESQANATLFLAKFYGRAGLLNLIAAGPEHLRPAIFRSLLYEACGRIVNPIYGSVGLLWSGSWQLCQAAVEAVLRGEPIAQIQTDAAVAASAPHVAIAKAGDIRHVSKPVDAELHLVAKPRDRFKRHGSGKPARRAGSKEADHSLESASRAVEEESACSEEASHVSQAEPDGVDWRAEEGEVGLNLTLGLGGRCGGPGKAHVERRGDGNEWVDDGCQVDLGL